MGESNINFIKESVMKKILLLMAVLVLVLSGCIGISSNAGYTLYDDKVVLMAKQSAVINYIVEHKYVPYEKAQTILTPINQLINLSSNFNRELYLRTYNETTQLVSDETSKLSSEYNKESAHEFFKEMQPWITSYTRLAEQLKKQIARDEIDNWNQQVALINQLSNTLNASAQALNQTANNMNSFSNPPLLNQPAVNPKESRRYMINTDKGLVHKTCITMANGSSYCY